MPPFDFPSSPLVDDEVVGTNGATYRWDGVKWVAVGGTGGGGTVDGDTIGGTGTSIDPFHVIKISGGTYS